MSVIFSEPKGGASEDTLGINCWSSCPPVEGFSKLPQRPAGDLAEHL